MVVSLFLLFLNVVRRRIYKLISDRHTFGVEVFAVLIGAYGIVPEGLLMPLAILLPLLEVVAGAGILFAIRGSLATIAGLLVVFMAVLGYGIWMGLDVDCGCFGPEDPEAKAFHGLKGAFSRDLAMLAAAGFIYSWRRFHGINPRAIMAATVKQNEKRRKVNAIG